MSKREPAATAPLAPKLLLDLEQEPRPVGGAAFEVDRCDGVAFEDAGLELELKKMPMDLEVAQRLVSWTHPAASRAPEAEHVKDILTLRLYTRVARLGSFSAAARECGLSQSQASRIIADLEAELGTRLLSRSTRAVVPTQAGADFLVRMEPILAELEEAENSIRGDGELRGLLRMSMPTSFGVRTIIPRLAAFTNKHPDLRIHLQLED
jgi:Bacterial regulatory helix-turn-helix protein, lysR family